MFLQKFRKVQRWFSACTACTTLPPKPERRRFITREYQFGRLFPVQGSYGKVYEGVHHDTGRDVAIKWISRKYFNPVEVQVPKEYPHPHLGQWMDTFETKLGVYIVTEKCEGDLFDWIVQRGGRISDENEVRDLTRQLLLGLQHLHGHNFVHCDLKLSNVLYLRSNPEGQPETGYQNACGDHIHLRIIDFGNCQHVQPGEMLHSLSGSPNFIAPEVIQGSYSKPCDLWSLGCIVFSMLFGFNPFNPTSRAPHALVYANILKGFSGEVRPGYGNAFPEKMPVSNECRAFIRDLLVLDARGRMTVDEALQHPWMTRSDKVFFTSK